MAAESRRAFLKYSALSALFMGAFPFRAESRAKLNNVSRNPVVISTWSHGLPANEAAWKVLSNAGNALDAVEAGVRISEGDPNERSVGYGGLPDRDGKVTLDACIMDGAGNCGAVAYLEHIKHPVSVARMVMEKTPHVMIVGKGALEFAIANGFEKESLLTDESKKDWEKWLQTSQYKPVINIENHDTIGMIALDSNKGLSGACTTSGLAYKMNGRVGDSPIIGAGLFVDDEVGGACATGLGEAVIKVAGSHLVVELMRQGRSPEEACKEAIQRIVRKQKNYKDFQVGFLALRKDGEYGAYAIHKGFNFAVYTEEGNVLIDASSVL